MLQPGGLQRVTECGSFPVYAMRACATSMLAVGRTVRPANARRWWLARDLAPDSCRADVIEMPSSDSHRVTTRDGVTHSPTPGKLSPS